jgi:pimeloyl-ACP methyl ester carboxylesterase
MSPTLRTPIRFLLLALIVAATGCAGYSSVRERRPTHDSATPAGEMISQARRRPADSPQGRIGQHLDAVASAQSALARYPGDLQARADYNFAVARIFDVVRTSGLEPWKTPLVCPGAATTWNFSLKADPRPERHPSNYQLRPADRYQFRGRLVVEGAGNDGLGAPLVAVSTVDATQFDTFAQGRHVYYGVTGLVEIKGTECVASLADPLAVDTATLAGRSFPLAADFTAPIALALAELRPRRKELGGLFRPEQSATGARLARLEPYNPSKIPVLCIHGLGDSHATWAPMIKSLRDDPILRARYQVWFFSYPTGFPYPYSASLLRQQMDAIKARHPDHKKIVVIGHSMGGMIARTLITESGMTLWNAIYEKPPEKMPFSEETRRIMTDALIFKPRTDISRVIFASASHRGADLATNRIGRLGSRLIGAPTSMFDGDTSPLDLARPNSTGAQLRRMPNSVDFLNPENRFVRTLDTLPLDPEIPFHSIIGDRGRGGNRDRTRPVSTDGIVPFWSSHLEGAKSELVIPSGHWSNQHPDGIAEVKRILHLHLHLHLGRP